MAERMPRLVYLAAKLERQAIKMPREIRRFVPNFDLYEETAKNGLEGAAESLDVPRAQMTKLYDMGREQGKAASLAEFRMLIAREVLDNESLEDLPMPRRLSMMALLDRFVNNAGDEIIATDEASLSTTDIPPDIPKWKTGFEPVDRVFGGGVYQGILMLMARPGEGKTSTMLSIMECIKAANPTWQMMFFEQEIPLRLMLARMRPILTRTKFHDSDLIVCGQLTIDEIIRKLDKPPAKGQKQQKRVVFIDSPDAMPGLDGENSTRELGSIFRKLVKIKEKAELVVVSTQPNRRESGKMTKTSTANSWEKVWYVDMMAAIYKMGATMQISSLKNRFGVEGLEVQYQYNLETMTFDPNLISDLSEDNDWSDITEKE